MKSVLLFAPQVTPRLQYIANFVSHTFFNDQLHITASAADFANHDGFKINYSAEKISAGELHIQPIDLLWQSTIAPQAIECFDWQGLKVFFRTGGDISFDIFAASFYLLSRYEEYGPHSLDEYGRYAHIQALAYKEHFLHLPIINIWWNKLLFFIAKHFNFLPPAAAPFRFIPTYDVDIAFSYKAKGSWRTAGALLKDMADANWKQINERIDVLTGKQQDPFDVFDWLHALHAKHHLQPVYFFLLAAARSRWDKNNKPTTLAMQKLVQQHAARYTTGVHPSWQSGNNFDVLCQEIKLLQHLTGKPIVHSRQHYIRLKLPYTYRLLADAGITQDYSMGYGSINGFRASVAVPFYWFDLERNKATRLLLFPFCYMDANAIFEEHRTPQQAATQLQQYYDTVKNVNGALVTVFHNHFLTRQPQWLPWRRMYELFLENNV